MSEQKPISNDQPIDEAVREHGPEAVAEHLMRECEARGVSPEQVAKVLQAARGARPMRLGQGCYDVLACLRNHNWRVSAMELARACPLGYRGRVSDLRLRYGVRIEVDPPHPRPNEQSVYSVPAESWARALWLLEHLSLEGYQEGPRQKTLL
jgi:sirohydrochlorin ferrochelatase